MAEFIAAALTRSGDASDLVVDEHARYFATEPEDAWCPDEELS